MTKDINDGLMLSAIRGVLRISQAELHRRSGVPHPYISNYETGKLALNVEKLQAIQDALGVSFDAVRPSFEKFAAAVLADGDGQDGEA
jgi:transcriptional regulator with XRE-family HTH domain